MTLGDFFYPGVRSAARSGVYWSSGDWAEISLGSSGAAIIVGLEFGESRGPGLGCPASAGLRGSGFRDTAAGLFLELKPEALKDIEV